MSAKRKVIPVFVPHSGCPNNCVFCNQKRISGQTTPATAATVKAAIENAVKIGLDLADCELAFYGGSFTAIPENEQISLLSAASDITQVGGKLRLSTRPDCISEHSLHLLRQYGVHTIELGCQSMDDEVLRQAGRGHTSAQSEYAAKLVKAYGFELILQMMTGLPGDTLEKSIATAGKLCALSPDGVRIYPTVIIRDTPLYDMWKAGRYHEHTVAQACEWCARIVPVFENAGIPVIRLGLNPSDELSGGEAAAGAYHPAFGEIVYARMFLNKAVSMLQKIENADKVTLCVNKRRISQMTGQKKQNIAELERLFPNMRINIEGKTDIPGCEIYIEKR